MKLPARLSNNPWIVAVVCVLCLGALAFAVYSTFRGSSRTPPNKNFYTTDFGKTRFVDSVDRLAPFMKDGVEAVRLHVFSINGKEVLGYLDRFTPSARETLERAKTDPNIPGVSLIWASGLEVRAINGDKWYPIKSKEGQNICSIPSKPGDDAFEILP